jgi:hypothetical protein
MGNSGSFGWTILITSLCALPLIVCFFTGRKVASMKHSKAGSDIAKRTGILPDLFYIVPILIGFGLFLVWAVVWSFTGKGDLAKWPLTTILCFFLVASVLVFRRGNSQR